MRSAYLEAPKTPPPPSEWPSRLLRWTTIPFAVACVLLNVRMIQSAGLSHDGVGVGFRMGLLEMEVYLAAVAILISLQILPARFSGPRVRRRRGAGASSSRRPIRIRL